MNIAKATKINVRTAVRALIFLEDGIHLLSGGENGMIRQWSVEDGKEVGEPMKVSSAIWAIALSNDCNWFVSGEESGVATLWNANTRQSAYKVKGHRSALYAVDISPDSTKFATGSGDCRAYVWDISTGRRLVGPLYHNDGVISLRFSSSRDRIATTTWDVESLRVYNAQNGELLRDIQITSNARNSIAWSDDSQHILSLSANVLRKIQVNTGSITSEWTLPGDKHSGTGSVALSRNNMFIAAFVGSSLAFWDLATLQRLGPIFNYHGGLLRCISLSSDSKYIATGGENERITVRNLSDVIPASYLVCAREGGQPQASSETSILEQEIEGLRGAVHALQFRVDELTRTTARLNDRLHAQGTPLQISDGTYRIKSNARDVYLTCPQGVPRTVLAQALDPSNPSQKWTISTVGDGAYTVVGRVGNMNVTLNAGYTDQLICVPCGKYTHWTFEPRGNAHVIGNTVDTTAIHLARRRKCVLVVPRNNSQNQRWVLERVSD